MIDFNTDRVMNISQEYLVQLLLMESFYNTKNAIKQYYKDLVEGRIGRISFVKSELIELWFDIEESMLENVKDVGSLDGFEEELLNTNDFKVLVAKFKVIKKYLYTTGLLKHDASVSMDYDTGEFTSGN